MKLPTYSSSNVTSSSNATSPPRGISRSCCCCWEPKPKPKSPKKLQTHSKRHITVNTFISRYISADLHSQLLNERGNRRNNNNKNTSSFSYRVPWSLMIQRCCWLHRQAEVVSGCVDSIQLWEPQDKQSLSSRVCQAESVNHWCPRWQAVACYQQTPTGHSTWSTVHRYVTCRQWTGEHWTLCSWTTTTIYTQRLELCNTHLENESNGSEKPPLCFRPSSPLRSYICRFSWSDNTCPRQHVTKTSPLITVN